MELKRPDRNRHVVPMYDLFAKTFGDYWEWQDLAVEGYFEDAPYDWSASRIGMEGDRIATHFGVWDFAMRIGTATARAACIGAVATNRELRKHGLMTETAAASINSFAEEGYDLSVLFGIQRYYLQFGYVSTFREASFAVSARDTKPQDPPVEYEEFTGDVTTLSAQYNEENAGLTGTWVRPTYGKNRRPKVYTVYTFDGGYVVAGQWEEKLQVSDCAGDPVKILDIARQLAHKTFSPVIEFKFLPKRSRMGEYLQTITHTYEAEYAKDGGPMIKVVNLRSLMVKLAPELTRRLAASPLSGYTGTLALSSDVQEVTLRIENGIVGGVEDAGQAGGADGSVAGGAALGRLVIGDDNPARICRQSGITLSGDAVHLVPVLFPNEEPSTILWDRF